MKLSKKHPMAISIVLGLVIGASLYGILTLNRAINTYASEVTQPFEHSLAVDRILIELKIQVQEWKNVLLRGEDASSRDRYWSAFLAAEAIVSRRSRHLLSELAPGEVHSLVKGFSSAHENMGVGYRQGFERYKAVGFLASAGDTAVRGIDREPAELLAKASDVLNQQASATSIIAADRASSATRISLTIMLLTALVSLGFAVRFSRSITRPIQEAVNVAHLIAAGDLSQKINVKGNDETADLQRALRDMQDRLAGVVRTVRDNADIVAQSTREIVCANQLNSSQSEEQSRALSETSDSVDELENVTRQNTDRISEANVLATGASSTASRGGEAVNDVVKTMHGIHDSANRIVDITSVIDDISFQTNVLALNAAVEAARAGDEGRGFAVVASEVRVLAQRSAEAAKEIKSLISASVKHVADGTEVVNETGKTMIDLVSTIGNVTQIMSQITDASHHQNASVIQASNSISAIEQALQDNAERVESSTGAAEGLSRQALELVNSVAVFRIPESSGEQTPNPAPSILDTHILPTSDTHTAHQKFTGQDAANFNDRDYRDAA